MHHHNPTHHNDVSFWARVGAAEMIAGGDTRSLYDDFEKEKVSIMMAPSPSLRSCYYLPPNPCNIKKYQTRLGHVNAHMQS